MTLTRAQVERLKPLTNMDATTVNVGDGEGFVGVYTALLLMIDTDAALRQQLDAMIWTIQRPTMVLVQG